MDKQTRYTSAIVNRLRELGLRTRHIEEELGVPKPRDFSDQAIDIEDDEVLEGLGRAAEVEIVALKQALERIRTGTYGLCRKCENPISDARLTAVPTAELCKTCAGAGPQ